jgi:hypothetical protein
MQGSVTLSSTEAEYVGAGETAQQMLFAWRIVESIGLTVRLPMILCADNTGSIQLANNWTSSGRTKHIDVRHHFLRELVERGIIKLVFVKTDENTADMFTKNLGRVSFNKHTKTLVGEDEYEVIEDEE